MAKYIHLYHDGCNGMRRGGVYDSPYNRLTGKQSILAARERLAFLNKVHEG